MNPNSQILILAGWLGVLILLVIVLVHYIVEHARDGRRFNALYDLKRNTEELVKTLKNNDSLKRFQKK